MRKFLTAMTALAFVATPALAHNHGNNDAAETAQSGHDHESKPAGAMDDQMKQKADDHAKHGKMDHGQDHMDHSKMDHSKMNHEKTDHSEMNHATMDHQAMGHGAGQKMVSNTMPADGAVLDHSPKMVGVKFGHAMMVDAITVSTLTGEMIELDVSAVGETDHAMVKAPELQPDDYIVDWRARGEGGHVMSGTFSFTVK